MCKGERASHLLQLVPCAFSHALLAKVGGHMKNDAEPESYVDEEGRFFKPYTVRVRHSRHPEAGLSLVTPARRRQCLSRLGPGRRSLL